MAYWIYLFWTHHLILKRINSLFLNSGSRCVKHLRKIIWCSFLEKKIKLLCSLVFLHNPFAEKSFKDVHSIDNTITACMKSRSFFLYSSKSYWYTEFQISGLIEGNLLFIPSWNSILERNSSSFGEILGTVPSLCGFFPSRTKNFFLWWSTGGSSTTSFLARLSALYFLLVFLSLMIGSQLNKSKK